MVRVDEPSLVSEPVPVMALAPWKVKLLVEELTVTAPGEMLALMLMVVALLAEVSLKSAPLPFENATLAAPSLKLAADRFQVVPSAAPFQVSDGMATGGSASLIISAP